jgi:hypothetical protein
MVYASLLEGSHRLQHRGLRRDIVVKTNKVDSLVDYLRETFKNLDRYSIKLNPKKCSLGVPTGKLLGYLISERGIKGNHEKIRAIINAEQPRTL